MTSNIDASLEETLSYIAGQLKTLTSIASPTGYTRAATDYLMETLRDMGFGLSVLIRVTCSLSLAARASRSYWRAMSIP